jgi:hypothetical protein
MYKGLAGLWVQGLVYVPATVLERTEIGGVSRWRRWRLWLSSLDRMDPHSSQKGLAQKALSFRGIAAMDQITSAPRQDLLTETECSANTQ